MVKKKKAKKIKKTKPAVKKKKTAKVKVKTKSVVKKTVKKTTPTVAAPSLPVIGEVTHFFPHVSAGVIKLSGDLKSGDMVQIKGHTTDFKQTVESMQIEHVAVNEAKKGQEIGLKVKDRVRIGDIVYKL